MALSRTIMGSTPLAPLLFVLAACSGTPRDVSPPTRPALDAGGATATAMPSASSAAAS